MSKSDLFQNANVVIYSHNCAEFVICFSTLRRTVEIVRHNLPPEDATALWRSLYCPDTIIIRRQQNARNKQEHV